MKKYEEPRVKFHELRAKTSMLQSSIENQAKTFSPETTQIDDSSSEPATQGFKSINAW